MDINKYIEGKIKDKESYKTFMNPALRDGNHVKTRMSNVIKEALTSNDMFSMLNLDLDETIKKAMEYFEEKYKESSTTPEALFKIAIKDFLLSNISEDKIEATKNSSIFKSYMESSFNKVKEYKDALEYSDNPKVTFKCTYSNTNYSSKPVDIDTILEPYFTDPINIKNNTGTVNSLYGNNVGGGVTITNVQHTTKTKKTNSSWY